MERGKRRSPRLAAWCTAIALLPVIFASAAYADWNGDGSGDVIARTPAGQLYMYNGNGAGVWLHGGASTLIGGAGWQTFNKLVAGHDFSGDGRPDILARTPAGQLFLYRGDGAGVFANGGQYSIIGGAGWESFNELVSGGDFNGDGRSDLIARTHGGQLYMYKGNGAGAWLDGGAPTLIGGAGWNTYDTLLMPGDFSGDGKPDLIGRTPAGQLLMYRGNGTGYWLNDGAVTLVGGAGWQVYDMLLAGGDFSGDRKPDILARMPDGRLFMYRGNGAGAFLDDGRALLIGGAGWNSFDALMLVGGTNLRPLDPGLVSPPPDPYPWSTYYGGSNGVDTDAEQSTLGHALATRADYRSVWDGLSPDDRRTMVYGDDPYYASWAPRLDRTGPGAPPSLDLEYQSSATRQGDFAWEPGDDPAIDAHTPGTGIGDRSEFRVRRQGSSWGSWRAADGSGMTLEYVDVGDVFDFQVRDYDRAGNVGAIRSETITIDPPEARAAVPWAPILACVRFCAPVAGALGRWTGVIQRSTRVIAISRVTQPYYVTAWNAARGASRSSAAGALRRAMKAAGRGPGRGLEAHHIIAWSHRYARFAQQVASRCGVNPNEAANGVYLTKELHNRAKTKAYYENINRLLWDYAIDCGTPGYTGGIGKKHLREFLQDIGQELAAGRFPG